MVIDIKITNSDGKIVHHFKKQFDEKLTDSDKIEKNFEISKDFEEFLAEYLSASGRKIRERLMYYTDMQAVAQCNADQAAKESLIMEEEAEEIGDSEMEYKIRIGDNKVIAGKIPFHRWERLNKIADALDTADEEGFDVSDKKGLFKQNNYLGLCGNRKHDFKKVEVKDLERNLKNLMTQVIEKYELNLYHSNEEPEIN